MTDRQETTDRQDATPATTRPVRWGRGLAAAAAVAILLVLGLGLALLTATGQHSVRAVDRLNSEAVTMADFAFVPRALRVRAGRTARFVVRNDDLALHTFTVDELDVDVVVKPRSEALVEFMAGEPGTYMLYCRPHTQEAQGMVAILTIE